MRLVVPLVEIYKRYAEFDRIHDPKIYAIDPNDPRVIDYTEEGKIHAQKIMDSRLAANDATAAHLLNVPMTSHERIILKSKIRESYDKIRQTIKKVNAQIVPRTQAINRKCSYTTVEEERDVRADVVAAQIRVWPAMTHQPYVPGIIMPNLANILKSLKNFNF